MCRGALSSSFPRQQGRVAPCVRRRTPSATLRSRGASQRMRHSALFRRDGCRGRSPCLPRRSGSMRRASGGHGDPPLRPARPGSWCGPQPVVSGVDVTAWGPHYELPRMSTIGPESWRATQMVPVAGNWFIGGTPVPPPTEEGGWHRHLACEWDALRPPQFAQQEPGGLGRDGPLGLAAIPGGGSGRAQARSALPRLARRPGHPERRRGWRSVTGKTVESRARPRAYARGGV